MTSPQFGPTGVVFSIVDRSHPTVNPATPGMQTTTRHGCGSQSGGDGRPRGGLAARWWPVIRVAGWSAGWWPAAAGWVGFGTDAAAVAVGCEVAAVGEAVQGPAAFVAGGVVPGTREGSVVDGGRAAAGGPDEVVPVGPAGRSVAPRPGAAVAVAGDHRPALGGGEEPPVGAGGGDLAVGGGGQGQPAALEPGQGGLVSGVGVQGMPECGHHQGYRAGVGVPGDSRTSGSIRATASAGGVLPRGAGRPADRTPSAITCAARTDTSPAASAAAAAGQ
jgi:hypothetical protein